MGLTNTQEVMVDYCRNNYITILEKQYDKNSRIVRVSCIDKGTPVTLDTTSKAYLRFKRPDGGCFEYDDIAKISTNYVEFTIPEQILYHAGIVSSELVLKKDNVSLSPILFNIRVEPSAFSDDELLEDNDSKRIINIIIDNARQYADNAKNSASNALDSQNKAKISETNAKTSETNAKISETNASNSAKSASSSANIATKAESSALSYDVQASEFAAKAQSYAVGGASGYILDVEGNMLETADGEKLYTVYEREGEDTDNAKYYCEQAKQHKINAENSKNAAKTSETNAKDSETKAKTSETNAKSSETAAKTSETNAKNSEIKSKTSETNAKNSETNTKTSETNAESYMNLSKAWAVGESSTTTPTDENNSKHYFDLTSALLNSKADKSVVNTCIANISYDKLNGKITATYIDGTTRDIIDTDIEKMAVNFDYDKDNEKLILTLEDGSTKEIDLSSLISEFDFQDSDTIQFSTTARTGKDKAITAVIKPGSITETELQANYLSDITAQTVLAKDYRMLSQSYAVGGTGVVGRENENTDNSKYYYEETKKVYEEFQKGDVTGIKGANETEFRRGNVSLSIENIITNDDIVSSDFIQSLFSK